MCSVCMYVFVLCVSMNCNIYGTKESEPSPIRSLPLTVLSSGFVS